MTRSEFSTIRLMLLLIFVQVYADTVIEIIVSAVLFTLVVDVYRYILKGVYDE